MRLLLVYKSAAHYREAIFRGISQEFDCDFVFGRQSGSIKQFDAAVLCGKVSFVDNIRIGRFYFQKRVLGRSMGKAYDRYLFLGDTRCLSTWLTAIVIRVLYPSRRIYFWTHGWYGKETESETRLKRWFYHLANGGVFLYGYYAEKMMIEKGFSPEKLFVVHNSLSYQQQLLLRPFLGRGNTYKKHFNSDAHTLLFVGRLTKVKCIDLLLKALSYTKMHYNLVIIGDGNEKTLLQELAKDLCIEEHVWFYGPSYDESELSLMISSADLCVSPGNVGLTAIHSMVYGTPVLTHNDFSWQMPEFEAIKEGETGCFFHRGDVISLADAIDFWFEREDYDREVIRRKCYSEIDQYWTPDFQLGVLKKYLV